MAKRKPMYEPNLETLRRMKRRLNQAMVLLDGSIKYLRKFQAPAVVVKKEAAREIKEAIAESRERKKKETYTDRLEKSESSNDRAAAKEQREELKRMNEKLTNAFFAPGGIADKVTGKRKKK